MVRFARLISSADLAATQGARWTQPPASWILTDRVGGLLASLGAEFIENLPVWLHEIVRLELEAVVPVGDPDLTARSW
jgi:hypothetical protein